MVDGCPTRRSRFRRVFVGLGVVAGLTLLAAVGGAASAFGGGSGGGSPCAGAHPPSYCRQSNWSCTGTAGACINGHETTTYPPGCPQRVKRFTCGHQTASCQGPSLLLHCTRQCHQGIFEPTRKASCGGGRNGANYVGDASSCTVGCANTAATGSGSSGGSSTAPPSTPRCTPSVSTHTGRIDWWGCVSPGVEQGTQTYTVDHSCPTYQRSGTRTVTAETTTVCQRTVQHQCAFAKPGDAQKRMCLTSPTGGVIDCTAWSSLYYAPHDCPIPTPVNF